MLLNHFVFNSYSLYTHVLLVLILIDVQYFQNVVFSLEKDSKSQNHSSSGSHHPIKKVPPSKIFHFPPIVEDFTHPWLLFWKPCTDPSPSKQKYSTQDTPSQSTNFLTPLHPTIQFFFWRGGGGRWRRLVGDIQNESGGNKIITPVLGFWVPS